MSPILAAMARIQGMSTDTWEKHTNPLSGWTRALILPLVSLVFFYRDVLGDATWVLFGALVIWTWVNPRAFPKPKTTDNWMSRAVMGERIWLNRGKVPVPQHYSRAIPVILGIAAAGLPLWGVGLWLQFFWPTMFGLSLCMLAKFWFLDRMVWLYDDMSHTHPIYREWLY